MKTIKRVVVSEGRDGLRRRQEGTLQGDVNILYLDRGDSYMGTSTC